MTTLPPPAAPDAARRRRWQTTTIASLVVGYAGYYVCRSNFSLAAPLLLEAFGDRGVTKETVGMIASVGVAFYAGGKLFNGVLADFVGGRRVFLFGMVGSVAATVAFGLGAGVTAFLVAWSANRLVQSMGWAGLVKVASNWVSYRRYGRAMGVLSLSFLFGDAVARLFLGSLIEAGVGWRGVFFWAAGVLLAIAVVNAFTLKTRPEDVGLEPPEVNPANLFGADGDAERPRGLGALLGPYLRSAAFWIVLVLSFGLTLIRETFSFWTPTYLVEVGGLDAGAAGTLSLLFPFFGGLSVLAAGWASDVWAGGRRGLVMVAALAPLVAVLATLGTLEPGVGPVLPLVLVSLSAFLMIGPYSFLAGAMSLDLGGRTGSASASGLIDSAGYLGGILSGSGVAILASRLGWGAAFYALSAVAVAMLVAAAVYWRTQERPSPLPL